MSLFVGYVFSSSPLIRDIMWFDQELEFCCLNQLVKSKVLILLVNYFFPMDVKHQGTITLRLFLLFLHHFERTQLRTFCCDSARPEGISAQSEVQGQVHDWKCSCSSWYNRGRCSETGKCLIWCSPFQCLYFSNF